MILLVGGVAISGAIGAGLMYRVLYNKPGKKLAWKIDRIIEKKTGPPEDQAQQGARAWKPTGGFKVEPIVTGVDFPVRMVFPPPTRDENAPWMYIAELGGSIKVVFKNGDVETFAEGLLNYKRHPLTELGLVGLTYDEYEKQFFVAMTYWDEEAGVYRNKVERLGCNEDCTRMTEREVILDMKNEETVASYQIQFCEIGPDGYIYVGVGSGGRKEDAQELDKFAGKVIRLNKDGTPAEENPFYDPQNLDSAKSYIYAYGFRNPFDITWDPRSQVAIVSDVGPGIDRIVRLESGINYCFANSDEQMRANALYTWGPGSGFAPVGLAYVGNDTLGVDMVYKLVVGLFGVVYVPGPNDGKRIVEFDIGADGYLQSAASDFIEYTGTRFASVTDVKWYKDGLYFADIYGEGVEFNVNTGIIYRVVVDPDWVEPVDESEKLTGAARGRYVFYDNRCNACHTLDGQGGREGPTLTNIRQQLGERILTKKYEGWLDGLSQRKGKYFQTRSKVYAELKSLEGIKRIKRWFFYHVQDPRFDNPQAKMPRHELTPRDIDALADFLFD